MTEGDCFHTDIIPYNTKNATISEKIQFVNMFQHHWQKYLQTIFGGYIMIKGCTKRVIVVRDIESNFFDEAFFIVKPGSSKRVVNEADYINEASRIVKSDLPTDSKSYLLPIPATNTIRKRNVSRQKFRDILMFVFGFGISAVLCTFIYYSGLL